MTQAQFIGLLIGITSLIGATATGVRFLVKHYFSELKPNHGSSIKDQVNSLDLKVNRIEMRVDALFHHLIEKD